MNPLTSESSTRSNFKVPFDQIKATTSNRRSTNCWPTPPGASRHAVADPNPLKAIDTMTERLDYALSVVRHLESVATTPGFARRVQCRAAQSQRVLFEHSFE